MSKVLIIAPHAVNESLECGGTILRHVSEGDEVQWLVVKAMSQESGFIECQIKTRRDEITQVHPHYGFTDRHELNFPPAALELIPKEAIIAAISDVMAATESFRYPFIKRTLVYETIYETDFSMKPEDGGSRPNVFNNISAFLENKSNILDIYKPEMKDFPFPRKRAAVTELAQLRAVQSNHGAAEDFMLIKEIN